MEPTRYGMDLHQIHVAGGELTVARGGHGPRAVMAIHGLAGSHITVGALAQAFGEECTFLAPDLRGRGASSRLPGPYGLDTHVQDCLAVLKHFNLTRADLLGHSLGGFIIARLAAQHPEVAASVNLVDGGIPLPIPFPEGADPTEVVAMLIGPVVENLSRVYESVDAYLQVWRTHPGVSGLWSDELEARFCYEIEELPGGIRARTSIEAVEVDQADALLNMDTAGDALRAIGCPLRLFRAERGILNQPEPTITNTLAADWTSAVPSLQDHLVPDTNHLTIMFAQPAVAFIAEAVKSEQPSDAVT